MPEKARGQVIRLPQFEGLSISDGSGGGDDGKMTKYVTKQEFDLTVKELSHQIEMNQERLNSKLDSIGQKIDTGGEKNSEKISSAKEVLSQKIDFLDTDIKKTDSKTNWIIGLILTSFLIPVLLKYLGI
ncbi:hypothetical protein ACFC9R_16995 [Enterococcus casseliflavus]